MNCNDKILIFGINQRNFLARWVEDNSKLDDGFTNWGEGQPNGNTTENCMAIGDNNDSDETWHDYPCGDVGKYFVCSKPNSEELSIVLSMIFLPQKRTHLIA